MGGCSFQGGSGQDPNPVHTTSTARSPEIIPKTQQVSRDEMLHSAIMDGTQMRGFCPR